MNCKAGNPGQLEDALTGGRGSVVHGPRSFFPAHSLATICSAAPAGSDTAASELLK